MEWQDYTAWGIVAAAIAVALRRLWLRLRKGRGGCASCNATRCPLRRLRK